MDFKKDSVYVCLVCGKLSYDIYGHEAISFGWDVSCATNCIHIKTSHIVVSNEDNTVTEIDESGIIPSSPDDYTQ